MWLDKEITINGQKFIKENQVVEYVKKKEESLGRAILENPIPKQYQMTETEFIEVCDRFDNEIAEKQFITLNDGTSIHVLSKQERILLNRILNQYYSRAFMELENAIEKQEDDNNG